MKTKPSQPDVRPVDLALVALKLAEHSGKRAQTHLPDAVRLLAKAASMLPDVQRIAAQEAKPPSQPNACIGCGEPDLG